MGFVAMQCPACGVHYGLDDAFYQYRAKGGMTNGRKASWCCPNGHTLVMTESEADRLRRERDLLQQRVAQRDDEVKMWKATADDQRKQVVAAKGQITKLKKRAQAGTCPCCKRTFSNMARHMKTCHADFDPNNVIQLDSKKSA